MYSFDRSEQLPLFLMSLGAGFVLGVVYDILRAVRLSVSRGKAAVFVFDFIYFLIVGFASFLFILAVNKGEIRFYILLGEIIGAVFYYFSFGIAAIKVTDIFVKAFRKTVHYIIKALCAPFVGAFHIFKLIFSKIALIIRKFKKKSEKSAKKHLPKCKMCVYNLIGILKMRNTGKKEEGQGRVKHRKKEKNQ